MLQPLDRRFRSGEINSRVSDINAKLSEIAQHYKDAREIDRLDGITIQFADWWCNIRPSNTEPLLRLNVEADSENLLKQKRDEVLALIRS